MWCFVGVESSVSNLYVRVEGVLIPLEILRSLETESVDARCEIRGYETRGSTVRICHPMCIWLQTQVDDMNLTYKR